MPDDDELQLKLLGDEFIGRTIVDLRQCDCGAEDCSGMQFLFDSGALLAFDNWRLELPSQAVHD